MEMDWSTLDIHWSGQLFACQLKVRTFKDTFKVNV